VQLPRQARKLEREWLELFDRAAAYRECRDALDRCSRASTNGRGRSAAQLRLWQKSLAAIVAIDYFPGEAREQTQRAAERGRGECRATLQPGRAAAPARPPSPAGRGATIRAALGHARRPWVDRVAAPG